MMNTHIALSVISRPAHLERLERVEAAAPLHPGVVCATYFPNSFIHKHGFLHSFFRMI